MTMLKQLPIGARVREMQSGTIFLVADHGHTGWLGTTLVADRAAALACLDAAEPENPDAEVRENGCNRYSLSNIHQWLNSDQADWFTPAHAFDAPPTEEGQYPGRLDAYASPLYHDSARFTGPFAYDRKPGYLARFSEAFRAAIQPVRIPCCIPPDPDIVHFGPPLPEYLECRVFLLSAAEIGLETDVRNEGSRLRLFLDARMRMCAPENAAIGRGADFVYKQSALTWWLRSPMADTGSMGKIFNAEHKFGDVAPIAMTIAPVCTVAGIRPALNLRSDTAIGPRDDTGVYALEFGGKQ